MTSCDAFMSNIIITFEKFDEVLSKIKKIHKLEDALTDLSAEYQKESRDEFNIWLPSMLETELLTLLSRLFDDADNDWIGYWIYELDFGERYYDGVAVNEDGENIPIKTSRDLWNLLLKECAKQNV